MKTQGQNIIAMHTFEKGDISCDFILKDGFVTGVTSSDNYHFHSFFEIHYVLRGEMRMIVNDRECFLGSGDLCIIPPNLSHFIYGNSDSHRIGFRFSFKHLKNIEGGEFFQRFLKAFGGLQDSCILSDHTLFRQCVNASREALANDGSSYVVDELLFLALDELARAMLGCPSDSKEGPQPYNDSLLTEYVEDYLNNHYQRTPKIGELAFSLNLSVRQTQRVINRLFGKTFSELLTTRRLMAAKFLLRTTSLSIEEIAGQTGFCDKSYFYRTFSAYYGITPVQYRNGSNTTPSSETFPFS